jgi:hypothetical protein
MVVAHCHLATTTSVYRDLRMTYWLQKAAAEMASWGRPGDALADPSAPVIFRGVCAPSLDLLSLALD